MSLRYTVVTLLIPLILYKLYSRLKSQWQRLELARQHGCLPVPKFSNGILSNSFDAEVNRSYRDGHVNRTTLDHYQRVGSLTYEVNTRAGYQICTADPVNHQAITSKINDFVRPQYGSMPFFGDHLAIIYQTGSHWKRTRDLIAPLFKQAESNDIKHFDKYIDRLLSLIPRGNTVDMQPLMRKLFFDSSTESIFGESLDSLRDPTPDSDAFIATYNRALIGAGQQERPHTLPFLEWLGKRNEAWLADCKLVHDFIDTRIAHHRNRAPIPSTEPFTLICALSPAIPDPVALRFHLLGIFAMAHETAAVASSNALFLLARRPELWTQLRHETLSLPTDLTPEHLSSLSPLFRAVVFETLRLHSPMTRITRVAQKDTFLPRGGGVDGTAPAFVPRGTALRLDWYPKFMDRDVWGEDAEEFRPERWYEDDDDDNINHNNNKKKRKDVRGQGWTSTDALPFSSGPRMCPAHRLVVRQMVQVLVRMTREFARIENWDACEGFVEGVLICFESRNGCVVALHPPA